MTEEEILSEVRDMRKRMAVLDDALCQIVAIREARFRKIMDAVKGREAPNDLGVAPDYQSLTHECAIPERFQRRCDECGE